MIREDIFLWRVSLTYKEIKSKGCLVLIIVLLISDGSSLQSTVIFFKLLDIREVIRMIKSNLDKAEEISSKLLNSSSMNPNLETTLDYSTSNAILGLEACIREMQKVIDLMASNLKVDSINVFKIGLALEQIDQTVKKVIPDE